MSPSRTGNTGPAPPEPGDEDTITGDAGPVADTDADKSPRSPTGHAQRGRLGSFLRTSHRSFRGRSGK